MKRLQKRSVCRAFCRTILEPCKRSWQPSKRSCKRRTKKRKQCTRRCSSFVTRHRLFAQKRRPFAMRPTPTSSACWSRPHWLANACSAQAPNSRPLRAACLTKPNSGPFQHRRARHGPHCPRRHPGHICCCRRHRARLQTCTRQARSPGCRPAPRRCPARCA